MSSLGLHKGETYAALAHLPAWGNDRLVNPCTRSQGIDFAMVLPWLWLLAHALMPRGRALRSRPLTAARTAQGPAMA